MEINASTLMNTYKWEEIRLPPNRDLQIGTVLERVLHHAGKELTALTGSNKGVTFWFRGPAVVGTENGGLVFRQIGTDPVELKAQIEGVIERCFKIRITDGLFEWVDCLPELEAVPRT